MPQSTVMPEPTTCLKIRCEGWNNKFCKPGRTCPSVYMACDRVVSKARSYCLYYYPARCRW
jgi:hypothetical protein